MNKYDHLLSYKIGQELSEFTLVEIESDLSRFRTMKASIVEARRSEKNLKSVCSEDATSLV
jgi:hypothetical protein